MSFKPTPGQAEALGMVDRLLDDEYPAYGVLTGYAGTGKTTLLKVIAEQQGEPLVLTPTGKAAIRVAEATGVQASTIHRWMYHASEHPKTGDPIWTRKPIDLIRLPQNGLVVIDEASMVGVDLWSDVWSLCSGLGLKVLLVGDRFQLGPVAREGGKPFSCLTDLKTRYRADLTEVVRQALDSPIIRTSMMIRGGEAEAMQAVLELPSVRPADMVGSFLASDPSRALIAWRNETRFALNREVRAALRLPEDRVEVGEPLLVLYNNYSIDRFNGEVLPFMGWEAPPKEQKAIRDAYKNLSVLASYGVAKVEEKTVLLSPEEVFGAVPNMPMKTMAWWGRVYACENWGYDRQSAPSHLNANFGYCLTAHKSQGSEWNDVTVVVEPGLGGMAGLYGVNGRRWLYTAVTRARKNVQLCFA